MYAITRLIHDYLESRQLKMPELAGLLGYSNKSRALRKLQAFTETGGPNRYVRDTLVSAAGMDAEALDTALRETREEKEREKADGELCRIQKERERFRPSLRAVTQRPAISCLDLFQNDPTRITLPDDLSAKPYCDQLETVRDLIRKLNRRFRGKRAAFGTLHGYEFHYEYGKSIEFDPDGRITELKYKKPSGIRACFITVRGTPAPKSRKHLKDSRQAKKKKSSKSEQKRKH